VNSNTLTASKIV